MSLRLIQAVLPNDCAAALTELMDTSAVLDRWDDSLSEERMLVCLLVKAAQTECMLDDLQERFSTVDGFRLLLLPVEATLPRRSG